VVSAVTAVSSNLFEYAGLDLAGEVHDGVAITRAYDGLGRPAGFDMGGDYIVAYGYDDFGRFASVSSSVCSVCSVVNYSCLPGADLVASMTNSAGFWWQRAYEQNRDLISAVSNHVNHVNPVLISAYDYVNDAAGRRVSRDADSFTFNSRSEVIGAAIGTNDYGYAYDAIGNRVWSAANTLTNTYAANCLNQYTAVTPSVAVAYDADGNMTRLGDWYHAWDAENRLVQSQPYGLATNGAIMVDNRYDHQHRRHSKTVRRLSGRGAGYPFDPSQGGAWDVVATHTFVYDGWNLVRETVSRTDGVTDVFDYFWGLDISGTLQGAGGVGGLLAVRINNDAWFFPLYDNNGNITEYVDAAGNIRAHYEYSPFGEIVAQSGDMADSFTHRFSTKPFDTTVGK
jgi:YD repeat-containing protein